MDALELTLAEIRTKATELGDSFGDDARARAREWVAEQVERGVARRADERLTMAEAALRSGYSEDHLARLVHEGLAPNAGRRGARRIRAGDPPFRRPKDVAADDRRAYDPVADTCAVGSRRLPPIEVRGASHSL